VGFFSLSPLLSPFSCPIAMYLCFYDMDEEWEMVKRGANASRERKTRAVKIIWTRQEGKMKTRSLVLVNPSPKAHNPTTQTSHFCHVFQQSGATARNQSEV